MSKAKDKIMSLVVLLIGLLAIPVLLLIVLPISVQTDALCLQYGWRDSAITWNFDTWSLGRYCIREENEYEIVCPLEDVIQDNCR